jgi:hypothetical protein
MSVEKFIKENVSSLGQKSHTAPDIPAKKLDNAIKTMAPDLDSDHVIALVDCSLFGSGKDGILFSGDSMYIHPLLSATIVTKLEDIKNTEYTETSKTDDNGKTTVTRELLLNLKDGSFKNLTEELGGVSLSAFNDFINGLLNEAGDSAEFVNTNQVIPLSAASNEIKETYLKILCNFAFSDDQKITPKEYAEIISLTVRIELESASRLKIRSYMVDSDHLEDTEELVKSLFELSKDFSADVMQQSLMKDVIYLHRTAQKEESWKDNDFIRNLQKLCNCSDEQADMLLDSIINDEEILEQRKNDTQIEKDLKDFAAKAAAVGIPMAAIYFSGSVVGVSAAGLTSGLAALGMSGLLGFSSMVSGIGVALLIGVGTYQGLKKVTGLKDIENNKQREIMIQSIIENSQKSLACLIEDLNAIAEQLAQVTSKSNESDLKIKKISELLAMLTSGASQTSDRLMYAEKEKTIAQLPLSLSQMDYNRILELTDSATKRKVREVIFKAYQESEETADDGTVRISYQLIDTLPAYELEDVLGALKGIGYFDLKSAAAASAKNMAKGFFAELGI